MLRCAHEINDLPDQWVAVEISLHGGPALIERAGTVKQPTVRAPDAPDVVARNASALHADHVDAMQPGAEADRGAEWDDIGRDTAHAADHRTFADPNVLMHGNLAAEKNI